MTDSNKSLEKTISAFSSACEKEGLAVSKPTKIAYGAQLRVSRSTAHGTVNVYAGKKGISVVVGGSAGELKNMLEGIRGTITTSGSVPAVRRTEHAVPDLPPPPWLGTDESGKGDFFGPLVVAGVFLDEAEAKILRDAGVRDSKTLTDKKIRGLGSEIKKLLDRQAWSVVELAPDSYNRLYGQFAQENKNLNHLLAWGHARAIEDVLGKVKCETVISDKFGDEKYLRSTLLPVTRERRIRLIQIPRAESNTAVAAASILARLKLLAWGESAAKQWGMVFPLGASPSVEAAARQFISKHGRDNLSKVAKIHFKTTARL